LMAWWTLIAVIKGVFYEQGFRKNPTD